MLYGFFIVLMAVLINNVKWVPNKLLITELNNAITELQLRDSINIPKPLGCAFDDKCDKQVFSLNVVVTRYKSLNLILDELLKIFIVPYDCLQQLDWCCPSWADLRIPKIIANESFDIFLKQILIVPRKI